MTVPRPILRDDPDDLADPPSPREGPALASADNKDVKDAAPVRVTPAEPAARVTPMMEQYLEIKAANPGLMLFYRMGDFYELFFEDAEKASRALGIVLTKRGKHAGDDIPMCGVPVERSEDYLHRLIAQGHRVAVCEQMEDPAEAKKRGAKSVVKRDVIRVVTPGTLTEDTLLDARANNYLLAIARARASANGGDRMGLAWIDMSTSEFIVTECVDRYVHVRIHRHRMRRRRACRNHRPHQSERGDRRRCAVLRRGAGAAAARARLRHAADARRVR
jgi:DNA mismatch repair protein MutS